MNNETHTENEPLSELGHPWVNPILVTVDGQRKGDRYRGHLVVKYEVIGEQLYFETQKYLLHPKNPSYNKARIHFEVVVDGNLKWQSSSPKDLMQDDQWHDYVVAGRMARGSKAQFGAYFEFDGWAPTPKVWGWVWPY
jgi:hypothetical protein